MKCFNHNDKDGVVTCRGCGKSLCCDCCQSTTSELLACSDACREKIISERQTLRLIRRKTMTQNTVSGVFSIMAGSIFGLFGVFHITQPRYFLPLTVFMLALCVGFIVAGVMYLRGGKEQK